MTAPVALSEAALEAMLDRAAERGATAVLERLGCPSDPAEATRWIASAQTGVELVQGAGEAVKAMPGQIVKALVTLVAWLSAVGLLFIAAKTGLAPPMDGAP